MAVKANVLIFSVFVSLTHRNCIFAFCFLAFVYKWIYFFLYICHNVIQHVYS